MNYQPGDYWSGRCTGYPRGTCKKFNAYAAAKMKGWLCKSCKAKKAKAQKKAEDEWREEWR